MKFKRARGVAGRLKFRDGTSGMIQSQGGWYYGNVRPTAAGIPIDETTALNLAAIWRGVSVLANDLAKMPLNVYERLDNGGKRPDHASKIYELLCYPNHDQVGRKVRFAAAAHLVLWGNAYQEIIRDPETGIPMSLRIIDPRWVKPRRDDEGKLTYWLKGRVSPWTGRKSLLPENCLHFTGMTLNGDEGISPVQSNAGSLGTATALDRFAGTLWGNGGQPNGVIQVPAGWPEDARNNFRQAWMDEHGGVERSNRMAILEEGAKYVATSWDPEKLQMLSAREFTVLEIARIVGVPPHKLYDFSHDVQRTLEESNRDYYETSLEPYCQMMGDEYGLKLLMTVERRKWYVGYDMNSLMRGNALERAQANAIRMQNGTITANEWRAGEGQNPYEEDFYILPMNMTKVTDGSSTEPPSPVDGDPADDPADPAPVGGDE